VSRYAPVAAVWSLGFVLGACGGQPDVSVCPKLPQASPASSSTLDRVRPPGPTVQEAAAFVRDVEDTLRQLWVARDRASWINENFITDDTDAQASKAEEATAAYVADAIGRARRFDRVRSDLPPDVARKFALLSLAQVVPAPSDAARREELAGIETWMTSEYGKGRYCPPPGSRMLKYRKAETPDAKGGADTAPVCLHLDDLSRVLATSRDFDELTEAWKGWHAVGAPMRDKYARYVELADEGARASGFADVGALWRASYDMSAADFEADVERLWAEVKPLYEGLHCFVRARLQARYGKQRVPDGAPIPAQLLGNMWAQEWNNVYDLSTPYPGDSSPDVTRALKAGRWDAKRMVRQGEHFFTALGFDPLPETFWQRSLFVRPRDRDVVCHASAWDVSWSGDLRIKVCVEPTEEDFLTIHHELGHEFYFQSYDKLPILFQQGANDGFHEAIGDTMALSVTPDYLKEVGLLGGPSAGASAHARIDKQLKMALEKVAFLPFGLLIDKWRWDVFSGKIAPGGYNAAWWKLKRVYQGVAAPEPRGEADFDPAAKFHVASSTPYMRYFLARIYQFQFHQALCRAKGDSGPLDECSIHDDKRAGDKLRAMLSLGASKPWPDAMEALGAGRKADASALLEYFAPLSQWLATENKGRQCGWSP